MTNLVKKFKEKGIKNSFELLLSRIYKKSNIFAGRIENFSKNYESVKITEINKNLLITEKKYLNEIGRRKYDIFIERLNNYNNLGFILEEENTILGYFWILKGNIEENSTGYTKEIDDDEIYLYDFFILKDYRGKGLTNEIFYFISVYCKENGIKKSYCIIDNLNIISQSMFYKINFDKIGYFITLKFRNRKKIIIKKFKRDKNGL